MTLIGVVCCNCYELGKLREAPSHPEFIEIHEYGFLMWCDPDFERTSHLDPSHPDRQAALERMRDFEDWEIERACEHRGGDLVHHTLANIYIAGKLRVELGREGTFPLLLDTVLYNTLGGGRHVDVEQLPQLEEELNCLAQLQCEDSDTQPLMERFLRQMMELLQAARGVGKPILLC